MDWRVPGWTMHPAAWWSIFWSRPLFAGDTRRNCPARGPCPRHNLGVPRRCGSVTACHRVMAASPQRMAFPWAGAAVEVEGEGEVAEIPSCEAKLKLVSGQTFAGGQRGRKKKKQKTRWGPNPQPGWPGLVLLRRPWRVRCDWPNLPAPRAGSRFGISEPWWAGKNARRQTPGRDLGPAAGQRASAGARGDGCGGCGGRVDGKKRCEGEGEGERARWFWGTVVAEQEVTGGTVVGRVMGQMAVHKTKRPRVRCPVQRKPTRSRFRPLASLRAREQASRGGRDS